MGKAKYGNDIFIPNHYADIKTFLDVNGLRKYNPI